MLRDKSNAINNNNYTIPLEARSMEQAPRRLTILMCWPTCTMILISRCMALNSMQSKREMISFTATLVVSSPGSKFDAVAL